MQHATSIAAANSNASNYASQQHSPGGTGTSTILSSRTTSMYATPSPQISVGMMVGASPSIIDGIAKESYSYGTSTSGAPRRLTVSTAYGGSSPSMGVGGGCDSWRNGVNSGAGMSNLGGGGGAPMNAGPNEFSTRQQLQRAWQAQQKYPTQPQYPQQQQAHEAQQQQQYNSARNNSGAGVNFRHQQQQPPMYAPALQPSAQQSYVNVYPRQFGRMPQQHQQLPPQPSPPHQQLPPQPSPPHQLQPDSRLYSSSKTGNSGAPNLGVMSTGGGGGGVQAMYPARAPMPLYSNSRQFGGGQPPSPTLSARLMPPPPSQQHQFAQQQHHSQHQQLRDRDADTLRYGSGGGGGGGGEHHIPGSPSRGGGRGGPAAYLQANNNYNSNMGNAINNNNNNNINMSIHNNNNELYDIMRDINMSISLSDTSMVDNTHMSARESGSMSVSSSSSAAHFSNNNNNISRPPSSSSVERSPLDDSQSWF